MPRGRKLDLSDCAFASYNEIRGSQPAKHSSSRTGSNGQQQQGRQNNRKGRGSQARNSGSKQLTVGMNGAGTSLGHSCSSNVGGVSKAPCMMAAVFTNAAAGHPLSRPGLEELQRLLTEPIAAVPKTPAYATLYIEPHELLRFVLTRLYLTPNGPRYTGPEQPRLEVHGSAAGRVVDSDDGVLADQLLRATDLDVRFVLPGSTAIWRECRDAVEEYLTLKASQHPGYAQATTDYPSTFTYLHKQALIGDSISVLSVGDPSTGRLLDMEFVLADSAPRMHFDEANSAFVPLSLEMLACVIDGSCFALPAAAEGEDRRQRSFSTCGLSNSDTEDDGNSTSFSLGDSSLSSATTANPLTSGPGEDSNGGGVYAYSLCGDYGRMLLYRKDRSLCVPRPDEVVNGLPMLLHALLHKGYNAGQEDRDSLSRTFATSFVREAEACQFGGPDPVALLESFVRSHYTSHPVRAVALVANVALHIVVFAAGQTEANVARCWMPLADLWVRLVLGMLYESAESGANALVLMRVAQYIAHPALGTAASGTSHGNKAFEELEAADGTLTRVWKHQPSALGVPAAQQRLDELQAAILAAIDTGIDMVTSHHQGSAPVSISACLSAVRSLVASASFGSAESHAPSEGADNSGSQQAAGVTVIAGIESSCPSPCPSPLALQLKEGEDSSFETLAQSPNVDAIQSHSQAPVHVAAVNSAGKPRKNAWLDSNAKQVIASSAAASTSSAGPAPSSAPRAWASIAAGRTQAAAGSDSAFQVPCQPSVTDYRSALVSKAKDKDQQQASVSSSPAIRPTPSCLSSASSQSQSCTTVAPDAQEGGNPTTAGNQQQAVKPVELVSDSSAAAFGKPSQFSEVPKSTDSSEAFAQPPSTLIAPRRRRLVARELEDLLAEAVWQMWLELDASGNTELAWSWMFEGGFIRVLPAGRAAQCMTRLDGHPTPRRPDSCASNPGQSSASEAEDNCQTPDFLSNSNLSLCKPTCVSPGGSPSLRSNLSPTIPPLSPLRHADEDKTLRPPSSAKEETKQGASKRWFRAMVSSLKSLVSHATSSSNSCTSTRISESPFDLLKHKTGDAEAAAKQRLSCLDSMQSLQMQRNYRHVLDVTDGNA